MKILKKIYCLFTSILVFCIVILIFSICKFSIFRGGAILIANLVALDILCTIIESFVSKMSKNFLIHKKKKSEKREIQLERTKQKAIETQKEQEHIERLAKDPNYKKIIDSESFVKKIETLSTSYDFGSNKENIRICISKISEIISILKNDSSGYSRVSFLFESYIPKFYKILEYYSDFIKADIVDIEQEKTLTKCVDKLLNFLHSQRIEAIFDSKETEIQFKETAENLNQLIDGGKNL